MTMDICCNKKIEVVLNRTQLSISPCNIVLAATPITFEGCKLIGLSNGKKFITFKVTMTPDYNDNIIIVNQHPSQ